MVREQDDIKYPKDDGQDDIREKYVYTYTVVVIIIMVIDPQIDRSLLPLKLSIVSIVVRIERNIEKLNAYCNHNIIV